MSAVEQFVNCCRDEIKIVDRLVGLLEQEQALLIQGESQQLEGVADSKSEVLDLLAAQSSLRGRLMESLGVQDKDTLYIWLADKPEACVEWTRLEDAVNRAQSINQLNAVFVNERLALVEGSLDVLRSAAAATLGYGRDGQTPELVTGRRLLGSA
ncbi:flagella synthesis protein FlgN [Chromobacterium piscinae]|uniref:flagella synthesis protein FlgN n=1 Tax=Chromobacterium piscinae TaxID=686831 RepID=UPI00140CE0CC|nr:flagellar protein FlgN [Chromobacterium piscinae]MBX9298140.1 flagellar protein FlgN [Chromobacterium vaccinii]MBX9355565.1 flagellar protein FlgN [Chromobacterium vaccinii]MCD5329395.1 flagellar protein FlgN [Chromobacterium piscinae]NHQ83714.1 flagellar protein FlgN [Chromobacterium vaccinii]